MNPQLEELASLYVLDQLDAPERAAFEARLVQDAELAALVRGLESAVAQRIRALPQYAPSPELLAGIEARIDGRRATVVPLPARTVTPLWTAIARWGIAAVIAIGVATIAVVEVRRAAAPAGRPMVLVVEFDARRSTRTEVPMAQRPAGADARFIQLASLAERYWEKPEELPHKPQPAGGSGRGYALFDPASNQGFIAVRQLPDSAAGKRCHVWIVDTGSGQVRDAGVLPADEAHRGLYFFSVAPGDGANPEHVALFVTAEDPAAPDSSQPRGDVVLGSRPI
jgi:hypothetical protein